jgi:hypothetical protein
MSVRGACTVSGGRGDLAWAAEGWPAEARYKGDPMLVRIRVR